MCPSVNSEYCRPNPLKQFYPDEAEEEPGEADIVRVDILPLSGGENLKSHLPPLTLLVMTFISIL